MHPPRTAPLHAALKNADRLEISPTTVLLDQHARAVMINEQSRDFYTEYGETYRELTTPTQVNIHDAAAVQEFVENTRFIEDPTIFALGSLPTYTLKFFNVENLIETLYIEGSGVEYLSWSHGDWGYSELTPKSSQKLKQWLATHGVRIHN